ncbi:MAG: hypothetical protein HY445_03665 [Candidatus Niyogibacteria bacterium]|nr:hypothetical protein [Candidatus Niyogibacteria bacterium]
MISQNLKNIKSWIGDNKSDLVLAMSFFLIAIISFGLGRISISIQNPGIRTPIRVEENANPSETIKEKGSNTALLYVGSKNGAVYHLPSCSGAKRIAEENKIWFSSREEAESLGYRPAKNCEGL